MREKARRTSPGIGKRLATGGGTVLKALAWVVAVPALCIVVGAVPLYLLLPASEPEPAAGTQSVASLKPAAAVPAASQPKAKAETPPASADGQEASTKAPDPSSVGSVSPAADEPPAESDEAAADPAPAPETVAVVPTPRPEPPVPAAQAAEAAPGEEEPATKLASIEPSGAPRPADAPRGDEPEDAASSAGGAVTVRRDVTLRASPRGREIGTLREGAKVAVGRCEEWCEVRTENGRGWVHSSFLAGALPARSAADARSGAPDVRSRAPADDRRLAQRREREVREARALARAEERRRRYEAMADRDPDWFIDDAPVVIERRRPPPPRYYLPDDYVPY